jgi:hypothetical protein
MTVTKPVDKIEAIMYCQDYTEANLGVDNIIDFEAELIRPDTRWRHENLPENRQLRVTVCGETPDGKMFWPMRGRFKVTIERID